MRAVDHRTHRVTTTPRHSASQQTQRLSAGDNVTQGILFQLGVRNRDDHQAGFGPGSYAIVLNMRSSSSEMR